MEIFSLFPEADPDPDPDPDPHQNEAEKRNTKSRRRKDRISTWKQGLLFLAGQESRECIID